MKAKCKALELSIFICGISILLICFFSKLYLEFEYTELEILLNVSIGLFGSSCVTLFIAIPEYTTNKRQLLEKYGEETKRIRHEFYDLKYLFNEYSNDVVVSYIHELNNKKEYEHFNQISNYKMKSNEKKYKDMLVNEYLKRRPELKKHLSKESLKEYVNSCIDTDIEKIREEAKKLCLQYIQLSKEDLIKLKFMLSDMQFLSGDKLFNKIKYNLYNPLCDILDKMNHDSFHFQLYLNGEGKESVVLELLFDLQNEIFRIKSKEDEDSMYFTIYNTFSDNLFYNLEMLRSITYDVKQEKLDLPPIESRTYSKKIY